MTLKPFVRVDSMAVGAEVALVALRPALQFERERASAFVAGKRGWWLALHGCEPWSLRSYSPGRSG
jgi:hypothetical protein